MVLFEIQESILVLADTGARGPPENKGRTFFGTGGYHRPCGACDNRHRRRRISFFLFLAVSR